MKKYSVRPATPSDIDAVHRLIEKQDLADYGESMLTLDDLREAWQGINFEMSTCMAYADGKLAGYGELLHGTSPYIYLEDRNNIDLGFQLLTVLEEEAASHRGDRVSMVTRVSERNRTLLELFASHGYKSDLSYLIMESLLDEAPPAPDWPEGIYTRNFVLAQDEYATYQVDKEALQDRGYHAPLGFEGWIKLMGMDRDTFDPGLWFLAVEDSQIVGMALNTYTARTDTGWVEHVGVRHAWQEREIEPCLLLHTLGRFHDRGVRRVRARLDSKSPASARRLYEGAGMLAIQQYYIYRKDLRV